MAAYTWPYGDSRNVDRAWKRMLMRLLGVWIARLPFRLMRFVVSESDSFTELHSASAALGFGVWLFCFSTRVFGTLEQTNTFLVGLSVVTVTFGAAQCVSVVTNCSRARIVFAFMAIFVWAFYALASLSALVSLRNDHPPAISPFSMVLALFSFFRYVQMPKCQRKSTLTKS